MIYIAGLGVAGSYLLRRLENDGFEVKAYDPRRSDYYLPCGYATNEHLLGSYLRNVGLDASRYVLSRAKTITFSGNNFQGVDFPSSGMCTIDKKRMEEDLRSDARMADPSSLSDADIAIDATGISRALLGKHEEDYTMYAREYLAGESSHSDFYFHYFSGGHGYFWEFPLSGDYHIGAGSDSPEVIDEALDGINHRIVTGRKIRLTPLFDKVSKGKVIGVGEAIGTVSPISGEGIIPSIRSAEILFQSIKKHSDVNRIVDEYTSVLQREMGYYSLLRGIVKKIQMGQRLGLRDLKAAKWARADLRLFGVDFRISRVVSHFL